MKIHHFDGIYQERWGFSWAMLVSGRVIFRKLSSHVRMLDFSHGFTPTWDISLTSRIPISWTQFGSSQQLSTLSIGETQHQQIYPSTSQGTNLSHLGKRMEKENYPLKSAICLSPGREGSIFPENSLSSRFLLRFLFVTKCQWAIPGSFQEGWQNQWQNY